jgi:DNA-directed RNA polymerase specialized sigma24 family protein
MAQGRPALTLVSQARSPVTMPAPIADDDLVAALRLRDATVAAAAHDRLRPAAEMTIACLLGADHPKRDEVVAIALARAVGTIDAYIDDCLLDAWTSAAAARAARDHGRSGSKRLRLVRGQATVDRVRERLQQIEDAVVWPFLLHDVCGFDLLEVAAITNTSVDQVQALLVRARRLVHARIVEDRSLAAALSREDPGVAGRPFFATAAAGVLRRASYSRRARPVARACAIDAIREALLADQRRRARRAVLASAVALVLTVSILMGLSCVPFFSSSR